MPAFEGLFEAILVLLEKSHRKTGDNAQGRFPGVFILEEKTCDGQCKEPHKISDHAILIEGEAYNIGLLLGEVPYKIRLPVHRDVEILGESAILKIDPELNLRSIAVNGLEDDRLVSVGSFGKTEADINAQDLHGASVGFGVGSLFGFVISKDYDEVKTRCVHRRLRDGLASNRVMMLKGSSTMYSSMKPKIIRKSINGSLIA
jgi:hypothetical protein